VARVRVEVKMRERERERERERMRERERGLSDSCDGKSLRGNVIKEAHSVPR
jgi:hypothetical protein